MTDTPDEPAEPARRRLFRGDDDMPTREKWLRLALITVGAALIASIFSVWSQRSDDDPTAAASETVDAESGTVTVDIDIDDGGVGQRIQLINRYRGDDYDTTISASGDGSTDGGTTSTQQLVALDGSHYYRSSDTESWESSDGPGAVVLEEGLTLPPAIVGWSTGGLAPLVEALELPDDIDGGPASATITVAEARALDELPVALTIIVDPAWAWPEEQPIDITITLDGGRIDQLTARADDGGTRGDGPLTISTVTAYADLGTDVDIDAPAVG